MRLSDQEFSVGGGYYPSVSAFAPANLAGTIRAGLNTWLRSMGRLQVANGSAQTSSTNVGARIFTLGGLTPRRAEIEGALVSGRLPFAGLIRYQGAALFFLSELTSQQVRINESTSSPYTLTGVTTSSSTGRLRIATLSGTTYTAYDAGSEAPTLTGSDVSVTSGGTKSMTGTTGVSLSAWRSSTGAISAPSAVQYESCSPTTADLFKVTLPSAASGWDGWVMGGTQWGSLTGAVRVVRYIYITPRGTFTATNGSPTITGDSDTFWLQDLRPGDEVTIDATSYTISAVTSQNSATLTANFSGSTGSGKTMTMTVAAADWYNSELGDLLDRDVYKPPRAAGILSFASRLYLWGTYGESGNVTGPGITPLLLDNPEHVGRTTLFTESKSDILNVLPGAAQLFVMTTTGLESISFTGNADRPYISRILAEPGFRTPQAGMIYKDRFYGYSEKPLRTVADQNIDVQFGEPVWSDMSSWDSSRVVMMLDARNEAVLFGQYDGSTYTTFIPYMTQLEAWGPPHRIAGQVIDWSVVGGTLYFTLLTGGNYRVYEWEGGSAGSASGAYVATQFSDGGSLTTRKALKAIQYTGKASTLRVFAATQGDAIPDVTDTAQADLSFTLSGTEVTEPEILTHYKDFRALAMRVDFPTGGTWQRLVASGYGLEDRR